MISFFRPVLALLVDTVNKQAKTIAKLTDPDSSPDAHEEEFRL